MSYGTTYRVTLQGDTQLIKKLETISIKMKTGSADVLDKTAGDCSDLMQTYAPVFTGKLKESIDWKVGDTPLSREIGPQHDGGEFPPSNYGIYVDSGGGPSGMPNVNDIGDRMGLSDREAFAFAKYLKLTGKAVRTPTFFVGKVADKANSIFRMNVERLFQEAIR
jgi:hypothetical protein